MSEKSEELNAPLQKGSAWPVIGARQGDIFTAAIGVEFREVLRLEMDADTWAAIMDDNPGEFSNRINGTLSRQEATLHSAATHPRPAAETA